MIGLLLADRVERGLPTPAFIERDIDSDPDWQRAFFAIILPLALASFWLMRILT